MNRGTPSAPGPAGGRADLVELGGRRGWSRRTWALVLVVVAGVLGAGMVVEDRVRGSEETALAACRATAAETLAAADERFAVMAAYLRPGLLTVPEAARASLLVVMSDTAADYAPRVEAALETCAAVRPVWFHRDLAARRDAYVDHLSATAELLRSIQGDGGRYYRDTPELDAERLRLFGA